METKDNPILVPCDFSEVAENALAHAVKFSNILKSDIELLNVVKKQKEIADAEQKLQTVAEKARKTYGVRPYIKVREGNIFDTIKEVAKENDSRLVIMGTHGIKGIQKFTGSWALKVIVGSECPFVVVQEPPSDKPLKDIVFPLEFKMEDKEKLRWANYLSKFYHVKLQIVASQTTDPRLTQKTKSNIIFAKKYLESKNIDYEITYLDSKDFPKEVVNFAQKIKSELILIMTTKGISFQDYAFGANEQKIIANDAKIPVMCVNPREDLLKTGGFRTFAG